MHPTHGLVSTRDGTQHFGAREERVFQDITIHGTGFIRRKGGCGSHKVAALPSSGSQRVCSAHGCKNAYAEEQHR